MPKYLHAMQEFYKLCAVSKSFMRISQGVRLVTVNEGHVVVEWEVGEEHTNPMGTQHGGFTAALADNVTTSALLATPKGDPGVSVDLHLTYLGPAKVGDTVVMEAKVVKTGGRMAFTSAEMRRKSDNALLATAVHTKALIGKSGKP